MLQNLGPTEIQDPVIISTLRIIIEELGVGEYQMVSFMQQLKDPVL